MNHDQLSSRRPDAPVDFRPDVDAESPYCQLRRLSSYLLSDSAGPDDITDCGPALDYWREYTYRKVFSGTSHEEFLELDATDPAAIDWLLAIHGTASQNHQQRKQSR
jgi:hypothetical protein